MKEKPSLFTIRQVIELTGVSEFTLRGWENRYNAIGPARTNSGRRMYEREDVLKIKTLKDLVDQGFKISSIADLSLDELETLLQAKNQIVPDFNDPDVKKIFKYVRTCEWNLIEKIFAKKRNKFSGEDFILKFLGQLLMETNELVAEQLMSIAEEHILSSLIKENLFHIKSNTSSNTKTSQRLVFATPEGDLHELGLLIAATLASLAKIPNIYIGPNTPKTNICEICLKYDATHLILSSTISKEEGGRYDFMSFINYIDRQLPESTALWVGGRHGMSHSFSLKRDFEILHSFEGFNELLAKL